MKAPTNHNSHHPHCFPVVIHEVRDDGLRYDLKSPNTTKPLHNPTPTGAAKPSVKPTVALVVVDEVRDDRLRDDVSDVLRVLVLQALKGDAYALPAGVERGAAAVAAVDLQKHSVELCWKKRI
jgi:hypothetical protein